MKNGVNNLEMCPLCGNEKKSKHLICPICYQNFVSDAGSSLAQEGKIIPCPEWIRQKGTAHLGELKAELVKLNSDYEALQEKVKNEARENIKGITNGKSVETEVFNDAVKKKEAALWQDKGGHRLYRQIKITERQIAFLEGFLLKLNKSGEPAEGIPPEEALKTDVPGENKSETPPIETAANKTEAATAKTKN